jgi:hypothetical protein
MTRRFLTEQWRLNWRYALVIGGLTTLYIAVIDNFEASVLFWSPLLLAWYFAASLVFCTVLRLVFRWWWSR